VLDGCLEYVQCPIDQDLNRLARRFCAPGDPQGRLVKHVVHTFCSPLDQGCVAHITFDDVNATPAERPLEIAPGAADEVVDHPNLGGSRLQKLIDNSASDKAGATRYQATCSCEIVH
jgi:hypothetical protein